MLRNTRVAAVALMVGLASVPALAEVYTWIDADGNRHFSDQQPPDGQGKAIEVPKVNTIEPPEIPEFTQDANAGKPATGSSAAVMTYRQLEITEPGENLPVRANDGNVPVTVATTPPLSSNHLLRLEMDGEITDAVTPGIGQSEYRLILNNVDRGSHAVAATVINPQGEVIQRSQPVLIHVQKTSLNQPGRGGANMAPTAPAAPRAPNVPAPSRAGPSN